MSKTLLVRFSALVIALAGVWVALTQQPQNPPNLTIEKVKEDLYNISGDGGNVAAYVTGEGVILVDDKYDRDFNAILAKVKSVTDQPVKYVLSTHHHGDHTGGNPMFLASAEIIAHRNARQNMINGKQPGPPRITFSDETSVYLGGKEVRARYFGRGHTNGDAVIYFPDLKVVHTGDLYTNGAPFTDYSAGGSFVEWPQTLDAILKNLDFDTVIPGHGKVGKPEDVRHHRDNFVTVRNRITELQRQNKSKADFAQSLKIDDLGWSPSGLWNGSLPGMYDEIAKLSGR